MLSHLKKDDNSYDVFYQNLLEYTKVGERMKHIFIIKPDQNNKNIGTLGIQDLNNTIPICCRIKSVKQCSPLLFIKEIEL